MAALYTILYDSTNHLCLRPSVEARIEGTSRLESKATSLQK